jgi:CheY-like chemotaxis protein
MHSNREGTMLCWNCDKPATERIEVAVEVGRGRQTILPLCHSCYASVYLPLVADAIELSTVSQRARSVLVVDDDPSILETLAMCFENEGFQVDTATNGAEALAKVRDTTPDAILLDLRMPVMSGQEFLRAWRSDDQADAVPVVAMSAAACDLTPDELGVQAFLAKPFNLDEIVGTVGTLVGAGRHDE